MRGYILAACLGTMLPSCGTFAAIRDGRETAQKNEHVLDWLDKALGKVQDGLGTVAATREEIRAVGEELKRSNRAAFDAADRDKDGELDNDEWLWYLAGGGAGAAEILRRYLRKLRGDLEGRIEHERSKRKAAEAAELEALRAARAGKST